MEGDKFVHTRCFTRDVTERKQAEEREREHQKQLIAELTDMRRLQEISTRLIQENNGGLYDGILDAAVNLMRSDMGSMQMVREHGPFGCWHFGVLIHASLSVTRRYLSIRTRLAAWLSKPVTE